MLPKGSFAKAACSTCQEEIDRYQSQFTEVEGIFVRLSDAGLLTTLTEGFRTLTVVSRSGISHTRSNPRVVIEEGYVVGLNLRSQSICSVPNNIGEATHLEFLDLSSNCITDLPSEITQLQGLRTFRADQNLVRQLPEEFGKLSQLEELSLAGNQLQRIPNSFSQLQNLQELNLSNNKLRSFPKPITALRLQKLDLSSNKIRKMTADLSTMENLQFLNLSYNSLWRIETSLPANLERLIVMNNRLKEIPPCFFLHPKLTHLNLNFNQIQVTPQTESSEGVLRVLRLRGNKLHEVSSLANVQTLRHVDLALNFDLGRLEQTFGSVDPRQWNQGWLKEDIRLFHSLISSTDSSAAISCD